MFVLGIIAVLFLIGDALRCYTCVGSGDEDCNKQGVHKCPNYSDACAIMKGQSSGVIKSCSYKSFCDRAHKDRSKAPGVSVRCCFSNECNEKSGGSRNMMVPHHLLVLGTVLLGRLLLFPAI
uniref:Lymphocyte antigen 6 family member pge n=1 Tax=Callorhinchus milii TaxID=7868 RepID=A0A4W3I2X1_CALMI